MAIISISGRINSGKDTVGQIIQYLFYLKNNSLTPQQQGFEDFKLSSISKDVQSGWKIKKWADKLKDIVCLLLNVDRETLEDREFKEKELGEEWDCWISEEIDTKIKHVSDTREQADIVCENLYELGRGCYIPYQNSITPRLMLQRIGTDLFRNQLHSQVWVNALMNEYTKDSKFIITDTRFPNEADAVKSKGGINIRIERPIWSYYDKNGYWGFLGVNGNDRRYEISKTNYSSREEAEKAIKVFPEEHESETNLDSYTEWDYVIQNDSDIPSLIDKVREILTKEKLL